MTSDNGTIPPCDIEFPHLICGSQDSDDDWELPLELRRSIECCIAMLEEILRAEDENKGSNLMETLGCSLRKGKITVTFE